MDASYGALIVVFAVIVFFFGRLVWRLQHDEFAGGTSWIDPFVERIRRMWP
jgi:hypothetical protein